MISRMVTRKILAAFDAFHVGETAYDESYIRDKIQSFVDRNLPIPFVLPAFPGKSINENSVSGYLPDLGEYLALNNLRVLIEKVGAVYAPGIEIHLVSDGHFFIGTGCMRPSFEIDAYVAAIRAMKNSDRIFVHTIHDLYKGGSLDQKLSQFTTAYMPHTGDVNDAILHDVEYARAYPDRIAFVYNEFSTVLYPNLSKNRRQAMSKIIARSFISHQMAFNGLLNNHFSNYVRLSIHQQHTPLSKKYYINLLPNVEGKGTPWFHVITENGHGLLREKRFSASPISSSPELGA